MKPDRPLDRSLSATGRKGWATSLPKRRSLDRWAAFGCATPAAAASARRSGDFRPCQRPTRNEGADGRASIDQPDGANGDGGREARPTAELALKPSMAPRHASDRASGWRQQEHRSHRASGRPGTPLFGSPIGHAPNGRVGRLDAMVSTSPRRSEALV